MDRAGQLDVLAHVHCLLDVPAARLGLSPRATHAHIRICRHIALWADARQIDLVCLGLDTVADVTINGQLVLSANNMFRTWTVDVKSALQTV